MHVAKTEKGDSQLLLKITAGEAELEPIRQHTLTHFTDEVKIPGFRPGKAPLNLIEQRVDQKRFMDEFMQHAINGLYNRALAQLKIRAAGIPQIQVQKFVPYKLLEFQAEVGYIKMIKLADYKKIRLAKPKVSVTAKDVDEVVKSLRLRSAERTSVDRPAKAGDEVIIDFSGKDEKDQPVAGADGKSVPLILGSEAFIPGFEEHLIGLKAGGDKEFSITFPADYGVAALRQKKVAFDVKVQTVNQLYQTQLDDAFAAKVGPFKTLAELKTDIKKNLTAERQGQLDQQYADQLIEKIVAKSDVKLPPAIIDEQLQMMEDNEKRNLDYRGQTWQQHLDEEGITEEQHRERHRPDAGRRAIAGLVLGEVADREKLDVTAEELTVQVQILKNQYSDPKMQAELDKPENQADIKNRMLTQKVINKLVGYASK